MKVHISLNVGNIEKSVDFYKRMLGTDPMKYITEKSDKHVVENAGEVVGIERPKSGYAKFDIADPPLNLTLNEVDFDTGGSLSHLGLQVESTDDVYKFRQNWIDAGLVTVDEMEVNCCYAKQDKTWVRDPDGNEWEAFVVLENLENMEDAGSCDCSDKVGEYVDSVREKVAAVASCCEPGSSAKDKTEPSRETCCLPN